MGDHNHSGGIGDYRSTFPLQHGGHFSYSSELLSCRTDIVGAETQLPNQGARDAGKGSFQHD